MKLQAEFLRHFISMNNEGMFIGHDSIQKQWFDDCQGAKFMNLLGQFVKQVIGKNMSKPTVAQNIASTSTPSRAERRSLLPLAIAHQVALSNLLKKKESLRATFSQLDNRLSMKENAIHAQVKCLDRAENIQGKIDARGVERNAREAAELTKQFDNNWEGDPKWKEIILEGNKLEIPDDLLDNPFPQGGLSVAGSATGDASNSNQPNLSKKPYKKMEIQQARLEPDLLESLDRRVKTQEARMERWKSFLEDFKSSAPNDSRGPKSTKPLGDELKRGSLEVYRCPTFDEPRRGTPDDASPRPVSVSERVNHYEKKLMDEINKNRTGKDRATEVAFGLAQGKPTAVVTHGEAGYSLTFTICEQNPDSVGKEKYEGHQEVTDPHAHKQCSPIETDISCPNCANKAATVVNCSETGLQAANVPSPGKSFDFMEDPSDLNSQQLALTATDHPSSPSKLPTPLKPQSSLAERTRKSMALAKAEDRIGSSIAQSEDIPSLPVRSPERVPSGSNDKTIGSETLVERTRKSMSLLPVKPRAPRTSLAKKSSKVYPTNPFETPEKSHTERPGFSTPPEELFSQNAKYASVFKSRPKIALSPAQTPSFGRMDVVHESEIAGGKEEEVDKGTGGSSSRNPDESIGRS